jgi:predicted ribosome quality control (RQC) complex YloA/Tae2 family protein
LILENFLVLSGRDPTQSELLCQKFISPQDFFVHSDMDGSGIVIVRKLDKEQDGLVPPTTLLQAGTMSICQSKAWESKITTSAFWAKGDQITKTSFAGDALPTGQFNLKKNAKKNYLPPVQLIYGIGLLFQIGENNLEKHAKERR